MSEPEMQVLDRLARGETDEVAAARLAISRRTLRRRVRKAMDKLGARSRFQAGVLYARSRERGDPRSLRVQQRRAESSRIRTGGR